MPIDHSHGHETGERLYIHRHSHLHTLPAEVKLVAIVSFIFCVIATPPTQYWAFAVYAGILITLALSAHLPLRRLAPRLLVEVPFILFAVLMPFTGPSPKVVVLGMSLSEPGLVAAWGILAKGTIGVMAAVLLSSTTPARDLIAGLRKLHVPSLFVQIASFMLRYSNVVTEEMHRMRIARESRGFTASGVRSWPIIATSAGALFIRSYERGERVHLAMLSRGYSGEIPTLSKSNTTLGDWIRGLLLPLLGGLIMVAAMWSSR